MQLHAPEYFEHKLGVRARVTLSRAREFIREALRLAIFASFKHQIEKTTWPGGLGKRKMEFPQAAGAAAVGFLVLALVALFLRLR